MLEYAGAVPARHAKGDPDFLAGEQDPVAGQLGTLSLMGVAHVDEGKPTGNTRACCQSYLQGGGEGGSALVGERQSYGGREQGSSQEL